jgi:enamine deaminase RidA (YjgF/YER057c/UK114 family)
MDSPEQRLKKLGITLPNLPKPVANYVPFVRTGQLIFLSGQGPIIDGKVIYAGKIGSDLSEQDGYEAARVAILNSLSILRTELGSLDGVSRIAKMLVWVNGAPGFQRQHIVANGASDLIVEVFGSRGMHARSAVSSPDLPFGIAVEIELVVEVNLSM